MRSMKSFLQMNHKRLPHANPLVIAEKSAWFGRQTASWVSVSSRRKAEDYDLDEMLRTESELHRRILNRGRNVPRF